MSFRGSHRVTEFFMVVATIARVEVLCRVVDTDDNSPRTFRGFLWEVPLVRILYDFVILFLLILKDHPSFGGCVFF